MRRTFHFTFALVIAAALISPLRPELMRGILDQGIQTNDHSLILRYSLWFVALLLVESAIQWIQALLANQVAQKVILGLRDELVEKIGRFKTAYFDRTPVGQLVTRVVSDIDGIAEIFSYGLLEIFHDLLKLVVVITFMFWMNWKMTLVVLIPIPVLIYATRLFQMAVQKSFQDVRNEVAKINVFIQEHVTGMGIVQIFNRQEKEEQRFQEINKRHRDAHIRGIWAYSVFFPVVELLSAASISLMLWYGMSASIRNEMSPGEILEFSTFISMMYRPIRQMADNFNVLQMGMVNAERVFGLLETSAEEKDFASQHQITKGAIVMRNVWFAYQEDHHVLCNINLEVRPGQRIAIVGHTGAGKSTLTGLLTKMYDISSGQITIDGIDISQYSLEALRRGVGIVPQEPFLFSASILENLRLFDPSISIERVQKAIEEIGLSQWIAQIPGGLSFEVRERGAVLSSGQRQLLSFARSYLYNPTILILDEATAHVDSASEQLIRVATEKLTQGRTCIIIAHRLSTIRNADSILVMDKGEIAESGTHEELIAKGGIYAELSEMQFAI